jgi:hypothetical protein
MNAMQRYQGDISRDSQKYGVDQQLTNAVIYEEQSHLLPTEKAKDYLFPNSQLGGYDGGVGVMQVSGSVGKKFGNYSKEELARDPSKNIDAGTAYLGVTQSNFSSASQYGKTIGVGTQYNGSTAYGQRVAAQMGNPNYNRNILVAGLQGIISSLQKIIASLTK